MERTYICIDLRSYYASVECVARGIDPLEGRLVVADPARGRGTICLAVSPALKAIGVKNRCRVFDIPEGLDYIMATPRMQRYMEVSAEVFGIYLEYIGAEDIHIYSVDECFIDITSYLSYYDATPEVLSRMLMQEVLERTGIPSTCGIGPNMFLAKVALDIEAKHAPEGIASLDRDAFLERIWHHRPLKDIWGIGRGIERRLASKGIHDLCGIAMADRAMLQAEFGINAELLIDHAWGVEPCTIRQIKSYRPRETSISGGQVLCRDYDMEEGRVILQEMAREALLELEERHCSCGRVAVSIGYSFDCECAPGRDYKRSGAARKLDSFTASSHVIMPRILSIYDEVAEPDMPIRRINVGLGNLLPRELETLPLFSDADALDSEHRLLEAILAARSRFGRNAVMWGSSLMGCATGFERAVQIGGHRA